MLKIVLPKINKFMYIISGGHQGYAHSFVGYRIDSETPKEGKLMKLSVFLRHPLIAPYKTEIIEALHRQADACIGVGWNKNLVNHPNRCSFKMLRTFANLTQTQASKRSRIPQPMLSQIEAGSRLPTKGQFRGIIEGFGAYGFEYAEHFKNETYAGRLFYPPVFYMLAREESYSDKKGIDKLWELTHAQWRNQVGVPIRFDTAREVSGVKTHAISNMRRISNETRRRIDNYDFDEITALQIFQLAIIYRISPLSLINAMLMTTIYKTNTILGGKVELTRCIGENGLPEITYAPNEQYFESLKGLIKDLGLIPEWQHPLWDAYMLSLLAPETMPDEGLNRYYPFPLTPNNFIRYVEDPMLGVFADGVTPPVEFAASTDKSFPHDELRSILPDDYYYYFIHTPKSLSGWQTLLQ